MPYPGSNIFCSGHATLADGKLLVLGGTQAGVTGERRCHTFDATRWDSANAWREVASTAQGRYYGTATLLGDGKVLASGGGQWKNMVMFGGATSVSGQPTAQDDTRLLNLRTTVNWGEPAFLTSTRPAARHGHSAVLQNGLTLIFGGTDGSAPKNDLHHVYGQDFDQGWRWTWFPRVVGADAVHGYPPRRSQHTSVLHSSGTGGADTMIVFGGNGGRNASTGADTLLNDVWLLTVTSVSAQWKKVTSFAGSDGVPSPRFGHAAIVTKSDRPGPVMVVYGGRDTSGLLDQDGVVWELTLPRSGGADTIFTWRKVTPGGPVNPGRREGHSATLVPVPTLSDANKTNRLHRVLVFGGRNPAGQSLDDVYELRLLTEGGASEHWEWMQPTLVEPTKPAARRRHAAAWDSEFGRLLVFGGEPAGGGYRNDLWKLTFPISNSAIGRRWPRTRYPPLDGATR